MLKKVIVILITVIPIALFAKQGGKEPKTVFLIESYSSDYQWNTDCRKGIDSILAGKAKIINFEMNTKKLSKEMHQKMADRAWNKFLLVKPDLVMLGDDAALKFLGNRFAKTTTPVIYFGVNGNPRHYLTTKHPNITGVLERPFLKRNILYIEQILPGAKRGLILFDTDLTSEVVKQEDFANKDSLTIGKTTLDIRFVGNYGKWKNLIGTALNKYDFIIIGLYQTIRSDSGEIINSDDVAGWTSANTKVPLFGFWNFSAGSDRSIGGYVLSGQRMGTDAATMALEVFNGKNISTLNPRICNEGVFLFSRTQLKKWKINLSKEISDKAVFID